jgi:hypothetical protein
MYLGAIAHFISLSKSDEDCHLGLVDYKHDTRGPQTGTLVRNTKLHKQSAKQFANG